MSFIEYEGKSVERPKTEFFDFTPGDHTIRVLNEKAHAEKTHWIKNLRIKCLGSECPICKNYPDEYPRAGFFVNVLDLTEVKVCPSCSKHVKAVLGKFPQNCPSCGAHIASITPKVSNKIVVLSGGKRLFVDQLAPIYDTYGDLRKFDLDMLVTGINRERQIVVRKTKVSSNINLPDESQLYNLKDIVIRLTPDEMLRLRNENVLLKDIYMAREDFRPNEAVKESSGDVDSIINSLFES